MAQKVEYLLGETLDGMLDRLLDKLLEKLDQQQLIEKLVDLAMKKLLGLCGDNDDTPQALMEFPGMNDILEKVLEKVLEAVMKKLEEACTKPPQIQSLKKKK